MTIAHQEALRLARKKVREARTDLTIAEFDCQKATEKLEQAKQSLRLLKGAERRR